MFGNLQFYQMNNLLNWNRFTNKTSHVTGPKTSSSNSRRINNRQHIYWSCFKLVQIAFRFLNKPSLMQVSKINLNYSCISSVNINTFALHNASGVCLAELILWLLKDTVLLPLTANSNFHIILPDKYYYMPLIMAQLKKGHFSTYSLFIFYWVSI